MAVQVVIGYTAALAAAILGFWSTPNIAWVQWLSVAAVSVTVGADSHLSHIQSIVGLLCTVSILPEVAQALTG